MKRTRIPVQGAAGEVKVQRVREVVSCLRSDTVLESSPEYVLDVDVQTYPMERRTRPSQPLGGLGTLPPTVLGRQL
jgi:hypothetical protein